ncbi:MAG: DUF885 domain-containing protein [Burkholderiales bacterium]
MPARSSIAIVVALWFGTTPFSGPLAATSASAANDSQQFAQLLARADEEDLRLVPQNALLRGDLRHAGDFGDLISDAWLARGEANLVRQLATLSRIDRSRLAPGEQIAYDTFRYNAELALAQHRDGVARIGVELPVDQLYGQHLAFQQLSSGEGAAPYKTVADYRAGLARFDGFVVYLDRAVVRMKEGLRNGRVQPRIVTEKVLQQLDAELANKPEDSPFYAPIRNAAPALSSTDKARFAREYRTAIVLKVHPALKRLRTYMAGDYLAAGRVARPGLAGMPGGAAYYRSLLEWHTTIKLTPSEIHDAGLAEVARIGREMADVRTRVGFPGDDQAFARYLQSDPRFKLGSPEALLEGYRKIQLRVNDELPKLFSTLPRSPLEVKPVPREQESSASAYYIVGTPDGARPGVFFVNTSNIATRTTPRMTALFLHEGMPGHHLQGSLAMEAGALPALLRFGWNAGYGEGWGLYAEWLGNEMGLYDDPYQYFGRLDLEMLRAARMVVDTGLHDKGWSRDEAIDYMLATTTLDRQTAVAEVDRYIAWPGQAPAYKVGELYIRRLRQRSQDALGPAFDVRRFHDVVLDTGAMPLHVLGGKVDAWIAEEKVRAAGAGGKPA